MIGGMGIGAGANVVGGLMQSVAASMAKKAQEEAFAREIQLQQRHRNEAFGVFQPAVQQRGVETARTRIGEGAANREGMYQQVGQSQLGIGSGPSTRDKAAYDLSGKNRAQLGGYSDWALNQMISNIRTQDELNRISSFAGGDAGVFPYKMEEAGHAGDELAFWGSLISSLGGGAGSFLPQGGSQAAAGGQRPLFDAGQGFGQQFAGQV